MTSLLLRSLFATPAVPYGASVNTTARDWTRHAYIVLASLLLWRFLYVTIALVDLHPDEAYPPCPDDGVAVWQAWRP